MRGSKVTFIIPSYNGGKVLSESLPSFLEWLRAQEWTSEVILIDDGSNESMKVSDVAATNEVRGFRLEPNRGKGAAIRAGVAQATGEYLVFTDNDIPYDYSNIAEFVSELHRGAQIVVGDRGLASSRYYAYVPLLRRVGSYVFTWFVGGLTPSGLRDTQCGLKAFRAPIAIELFSRTRIWGFAFDVEVLFMCKKWKIKVSRLPVRLRSQKGQSVSMIKHGSQMFIDVFRIRFYDLLGYYQR